MVFDISPVLESFWYFRVLLSHCRFMYVLDKIGRNPSFDMVTQKDFKTELIPWSKVHKNHDMDLPN